MAIESANYVSQLDPSYPASTDNLADADNHLRLIKQTLKNTFPNLGAVYNGTANDLKGTIPVGGIIAWNGALNAIPGGWVLCAGQTNLTRSDGLGTINAPDLRDRFILGAGTTAVGATGGSVALAGTTSTAGAHAHGGSTDSQGAHSHGGATAATTLTIAQMPAHDHALNVKVVGTAADGTFAAFVNNGTTNYATSTESRGGGSAHTHGISSDGAHTHNIGTDTQGAHTHTVSVTDGRPPFYALAYIMRI